MTEEFNEAKSIISADFDLQKQEFDAKEELIKKVAEKVEFHMENNMELFFNHLYRMDINELKVEKILYDPESEESVYISLAKLIVERQFQRLETKRKYKQDEWIDI
jgi:hypothetical protein